MAGFSPLALLRVVHNKSLKALNVCQYTLRFHTEDMEGFLGPIQCEYNRIKKTRHPCMQDVKKYIFFPACIASRKNSSLYVEHNIAAREAERLATRDLYRVCANSTAMCMRPSCKGCSKYNKAVARHCLVKSLHNYTDYPLRPLKDFQTEMMQC